MPVSSEIDLQAYIDLANQRLDQLLPPVSVRPEPLHEAMRYSCLAPGKRLRPALCMAAAQACGSKATDVLDAACAMEMVHCFSLIHDDLPAIDDDDLRRGRPTCHKEFGEALAILAGDALFALAYETLSYSPHAADKVLRATQILSKAVGSDGLVGGEVSDILSEGQDVPFETLEFIHTRKTGALISASCEIGALLVGGTQEQIASLKSYGEHVGLAFQIADDLLNELSTEAVLGKATGSDKERAKATYTGHRGIEGARQAARQEAEKAVACLTAFEPGRLNDLAFFAIERVH